MSHPYYIIFSWMSFSPLVLGLVCVCTRNVKYNCPPREYRSVSSHVQVVHMQGVKGVANKISLPLLWEINCSIDWQDLIPETYCIDTNVESFYGCFCFWFFRPPLYCLVSMDLTITIFMSKVKSTFSGSKLQIFYPSLSLVTSLQG